MHSSPSLFVWSYLPGETVPVVAGRLDVSRNPSGSVGRFVYGQSYLARPGAVPIDPVSLPLRSGETTFSALKGFPGVILDACPDKWGIKVIDRLVGQQDYPSGYMLLNDPGRAGCLAFSLSAAEAPKEMESRQFSLSDLLAAAEAVEADQPVDPELLKALHPGTGGARPKCNITDEEGVWIAKFPSADDDPALSVPRLEHATMSLGSACGINMAMTKIMEVDGRDVCLVKRFDRDIKDGLVHRKGVVSARTVFYADSGFAAQGSGSYGRLSRWMPRYGCGENDRLELFRRMVFNCVVRNSDDHELNHGLVHVKGDTFELAPAYDVVPLLKRTAIHYHALLIGDSAAGTVANLVSNAQAFGISRDVALAIVEFIQQKVRAEWQDVFYEAGFGDEDLRQMEHVFKTLPLDVVRKPGMSLGM